MTDQDPKQTTLESGSGGLHLPSFKDLVSFSKSNAHGNATSPFGEESRREFCHSSATPSQRDSNSSMDRFVSSQIPSDLSSLPLDSDSQHRPGQPVRPNISSYRAPEQIAHNSRSDTPYLHGMDRLHQSPRGEVLRSLDAVATHKRAYDSMRYESSRMRPPHIHKLSSQTESSHLVRPTSYPMRRSVDEYRQIAPRPSNTQHGRFEDPGTASRSIHQYSNQCRPLPTQPIPSQGSHVASQSSESPQQYQKEVRIRSQQRERVARQHHNGPESEQGMLFDQAYSHAHPSTKAHVNSYNAAQKLSPSMSSSKHSRLSRGMFTPSHSQNPSTSLSMSNGQSRMFDYSCARLPDDGSLPSPTTSMRPPSAYPHPARSQPDPSNVAAGERTAERRSRVPSGPDASLRISREERMNRSMALRRADEPLPSTRYELEHRGVSNGQLLHRAPTYVHQQPRSTASIREELPPTMPQVQQDNARRLSPAEQVGYGSRSASSNANEVEFVKERFISNGFKIERFGEKVEQSSRMMDSHHQERASTRAHAASPQQQVWEREQRQRRQLEEERHHPMQQQQHYQSAHQYQPRNNVHDLGSQFLKERARREQQQSQTQTRPQSMTSPSHHIQAESSRQMRASPPSPGQDERRVEKGMHYVQTNSGRQVLPSPRTMHSTPAVIEPSYHQKEGPSQKDAVRPSASQRFYSSPVHETVEINSRSYADSSRTASSYRDEQLQRFIINGASNRTEREAPASHVYRREASLRYSDNGRPGGAYQMYHETSAPSIDRDPSDSRSGVQNGSGHRRRDVASSHDYRPKSPSDTANQGAVPHPNPPVIASQHTSFVQRHPIDQLLTSNSSPQIKPIKRMRAGSDTSLVLKISRFAVGADEEPLRCSPAAANITSPTNTERVKASVEQQTNSETRLYRSSDKPDPVTGSAPMTPPPSN